MLQSVPEIIHVFYPVLCSSAPAHFSLLFLAHPFMVPGGYTPLTLAWCFCILIPPYELSFYLFGLFSSLGSRPFFAVSFSPHFLQSFLAALWLDSLVIATTCPLLGSCLHHYPPSYFSCYPLLLYFPITHYICPLHFQGFWRAALRVRISVFSFSLKKQNMRVISSNQSTGFYSTMKIIPAKSTEQIGCL